MASEDAWDGLAPRPLPVKGLCCTWRPSSIAFWQLKGEGAPSSSILSLCLWNLCSVSGPGPGLGGCPVMQWL